MAFQSIFTRKYSLTNGTRFGNFPRFDSSYGQNSKTTTDLFGTEPTGWQTPDVWHLVNVVLCCLVKLNLKNDDGMKVTSFCALDGHASYAEVP